MADDELRVDEEFMRRLKHEFTVQSLLFAFDALEWLGFKPMGDERDFWIADSEGNPIDKDSPLVERLTGAVKGLRIMAPLAVDALEKRLTPGEAGIDAGGALLEAYDRWTSDGGLLR